MVGWPFGCKRLELLDEGFHDAGHGRRYIKEIQEHALPQHQMPERENRFLAAG